MPRHELLFALRALRDGGVEFIVVGGVAAVLNGAPVDTFDVDVVHSRDPANIGRLLPVLDELGHPPWLVLLGAIGRDLAYDDLLPHSVELEVGGGIRIRVLDLETLIAIKEELGGDKDRAVLPILRGTLEEKRRL